MEWRSEVKRIIFLFLLTFLIPITNVNGFYCKFSEISRYKSLASNISTFYDYQETETGVTFTITLVNLNKELYIIDATNNKKYNYTSNELTISGYNPGQTVKYNVYTINEDCNDELLYTIRVVLPDYNPYYNDQVCEGVDYIYCQKWYKHNLDYNLFVNKVNAYKGSLIQEPIIEPIIEPEEYGLLTALLDILLSYYHVILITVIVICSTIIYVTNKKSDIYR